ncbi:MAG: rhamnogalacturonan acetylesterase [Undibacterium sp.]|nr:rhamnogalacturonan acetylesterase [Opitutaceae bacterium]
MMGVLSVSAAEGYAAAASRVFDFGATSSSPVHTPVQPADIYSATRGYGFELGAKLTTSDHPGRGASLKNSISSQDPFSFSVALPEGNYRVTVTLGDATHESDTTIKAELRRLMLEAVQTKPGQFITRTFNVSVRTAKISTGGVVRLKERELTSELVNWDDKLTLEFNGPHPCVSALEITRVEDVTTVFLLGDSTVCDQPKEPWNSWGQMLPRFFDDRVAVANHAQSGESLRSSLGARRLDKVVSVMRPGDYLFIQYGHNDMKERGVGIGAFTSYKADLERFVAAARAHGGIPVLVTSMHRKSLDGAGKIQNTLGHYPEAVRSVAREQKVALIDLNALSAQFYEALGPMQIGSAFQDGTHHNNYGSYELAKCVVAGIRAAKLDLAQHLAADAIPFDPTKPDAVADFKMPASPQASTVRPDGS